MRRIAIALAAIAAVGITLPVVSGVQAETVKKVIIKRGGHHDGWRRDHGWHRGPGWHRGTTKKVIIKRD